MRGLFLVVASTTMTILVALTGCGGDDEGGSGGSGPGGSGVGASGGSTSSSMGGSTGTGNPSGCSAGMATLTGTLDGMTVDVSAALNARLINQASDPKTVTIGWDGGSVTFEWTGDYASAGVPTSATGTLRLDGTTYCFDSGSFTIEDDGFDRWTVSGFSESPDDGETCPGTTMLDGEVEGCADENGPS